MARGKGEGSVYMALVNARPEAGRGTAPEVYANELAGNVLMPAKEVRACIAQGMDTITMTASPTSESPCPRCPTAARSWVSDPAQAGEDPLDRLPDDQMPLPEPAGARRPRPPVPRDLAETEDPDQDLPGAGTQDATQSLAHMTRMRPFLYLFVAYARTRYSRMGAHRSPPPPPVDRTAQERPRLYQRRTGLDIAFLTLACLLLLTAVGAGAYKIILK